MRMIAAMADSLAVFGLILRGGFAFGADQTPPAGPSGNPAKSVLLVGHGGGTIWPHFMAWLERQPAGIADPLDTWSREVIDAVAAQTGGRAVYPSDKPYMPFQQWAMRAEGLKPSPLGILMHPGYGLWHAYRGALLFDVEIPIQALRETIHLCDLCAGKPCLNACPVDAFSHGAFNAAACRSWLETPDGARCIAGGCHARAACPHDAHAYGSEQLRFHMHAFARGLRRPA
jgi:ferredoxin